MFSGIILTIIVVSTGESASELVAYDKVIEYCEQKLLQENAPRTIVCEISAVAVDKQINGENK
jgi:hypothetical protein